MELTDFELPDNLLMEDRLIPSADHDRQILVRIFTPVNVADALPLILEIHGAGWASGNPDVDACRCIELAKRVPAIVICVDYRLSKPEICYPVSWEDCLTVYQWITDHAAELGGDVNRVGLHGIGAGGNLAADLVLHLRNHNGSKCSLAVLNCPAVQLAYTGTIHYHPEKLRGLCPHFILTAECDPLRDSSVRYASWLRESDVPCELFVAPEIRPGTSGVHHSCSEQLHNLIAASFRRKFEMPDSL